MNQPVRGYLAVGAVLLVAVLVWVGCGSNLPQLIFGPAVSGNQPPVLTILDPNTSRSINQGELLNIRWTDSDPDSSALISFYFVNVTTGAVIPLVTSIPENDTLAPDNINVSTALVPLGSYNLRGDIDDDLNPTVSVFALVADTSNTRVVIQVSEPGQSPLSVPPRLATIEPNFNQGVAQDDTLTVVVRPTTNIFDDVTPFDPDSDSTLYIVLDLDQSPTNDSVLAPDPDRVIVLRQRAIVANTGGEQRFDIPIDLAQVPARPNGEPYFIRGTIVDAGNPPVHSYASGSINVVRSATGAVDLTQIGLTLAGARFIGFNPGARLGSRMVSLGDFDGDGIDDFMLLAQYGVPRNIGNLGEGYLIYGLPRTRFGGTTNVNTVSTDISGVVFEAPPNRLSHLHAGDQYTPLGLTDVSILPDVSGDGRPELLFGLPLVDGIWTARDDDYGDSPAVEIVEFTLREGQRTRTINGVDDENIGDDDYQGTIDTYLSRNQPGTSFGDATQLLVSSVPGGGGTDQQINQWAIIGFSEVLFQFIFRDRDEVTIQEATIEFGPRTFFGGPDAITVAQLIVPVSEAITFNSFAGGDEPGPEDQTDYEEEAEISFNVANGMIEADVTDTIVKLIEGELETVDPAWIIFPSADSTTFNAQFDSAESLNEVFRPILRVRYAEALPEGSSNYNCYTDVFPNNRSDPTPTAPQNPPHDSTYEAIGSVIFVNSENRDNAGFVNPDRLERVAIPLELAGMPEPAFPLPAAGGLGIPPPDEDGQTGQLGGVPIGVAGDPDNESGRLRGARLTASYWDFYNTAPNLIGTTNPRLDLFGTNVAWIPDLNHDNTPEIIISAPRNELAIAELTASTSESDRRVLSTNVVPGSIYIIPGTDLGASTRARGVAGENTVPWQNQPGAAACNTNDASRDGVLNLANSIDIFAENINDMLGGADYAGDVNLDGVPDIICGAPLNNHPNGLVATGSVYVIYGRPAQGNVRLNLLDDPLRRPPTLRIRGETGGDRLGDVHSRGLDINGDRIDDIFFSSPSVDFGGVSAGLCGDADGNGIRDGNDLDLALFNTCRGNFGSEVFVDDEIGLRSCKAFDFDNDRDIDDADRDVFDCLIAGFSNCCPVDNGFVGVIFGNINLDGDRTLSQIATNDLPGIKFFGANAGDRAGADMISAGDFNRDGFGDLLIAAPGVRFTDANGRARMGVAYLVFGGTHLNGNRTFSLEQVGSAELPGLVFQTPYFSGRPNEAPIDHVGFLGDINGDGFDDVALGVTRADFIDSALPQNPNDPGTNPNIGRRPDDGAVFIVYGNNTGSNQ